MKRNLIFPGVMFGAAAMLWCVTGQEVRCSAAEKPPEKDPQIAQLHMSLRGVSG